MAENFQNTVGSLFKGMEEFITTKTVVGDPVTVGDTIIVPLVDVSFGVGASAKTEEKKNQRRRRHRRKDFSERGACDFKRYNAPGQCKESGQCDKNS